MVSALDSGSSHLGSWVLAGGLCCVIGQYTLLSCWLSPPRCINGYRRIYSWGQPYDGPASHLGGSRNTPIRFMLHRPYVLPSTMRTKHASKLHATETGISSGLMGHVARTQPLPWFRITTLIDWLKNLAPFFQPVRSKKTKTNRDALVQVFPALRPGYMIASSFDWNKDCSAFFVIGHGNYVLVLRDTHLKTALIKHMIIEGNWIDVWPYSHSNSKKKCVIKFGELTFLVMIWDVSLVYQTLG